VAVINNAEPDRIYVAAEASPLVIGLGDGGNLIASDVPALLPFTRRVIHLRDSEIAVLTGSRVEVSTLDGGPVEREPVLVEWNLEAAEKNGHEHFMHKEIHEQPRVLRDTICDRITLDGRDVLFGDFDAGGQMPGRIVVVACGTAYHAGLLAKYWIEELAGCPVEVDLASEFRYRGPLIDEYTLAVAVSQSGETADTLAALKLARNKGARTLSVCNVVDSSIPRHSDQVIYTRAGPEIGVASTKAFVSQLSVLFMLAVHLGRRTGKLSGDRAGELLDDLRLVPDLLERALQNEPDVSAIARRFCNIHNWLFLGRWLQFPIALEGALKLKEITYSHAEGYPAGEMKHGPIALVDEETLVVSVCTHNRVYEKILSNMQEVRARKGRLLAVASEGDGSVAVEADEVVRVPEVGELLEPLLTVVPLQLLSYHVANIRGLDVDRPRNLAKSVTVE
jgi:glucosamine--fructose-6-phosphate aminotransferase (isomerizing)